MRVAFWSDVHFPTEVDMDAARFAAGIVKESNVDHVVWGGDIQDVHGLGRWTKAPTDVGRFQREVDRGVEQWGEIIDIMGVGKNTFYPGNHENRIERYMLSKAPELYGMKHFGYRTLFELDNLGVDMHEGETPFKIGKLYFLHGHERNIAKLHDSVIFGHHHKFSIVHETSLGHKVYRRIGNGCLSNMMPDYTFKPDWAQGFTMIDFAPSGMFQVQQIFFWRENNRLHASADGKMFVEKKKRGRKRGSKS